MDDLNLTSTVAKSFINEFISGVNSMSNIEQLSINSIQLSHSALKWILESRSTIDIPDNQLDEVLDKTAILLATVYKDKESLPIIADLIFERHRKGCFNHDLIWAFFESCDTHSLFLIANRLLSTQPKDVQLARQLLGFIPGISNNWITNKNKLYSYFANWFEENNLFLHFTGESFNLTSNPIPYAVVLEAKYLYKPVSIDTGLILEELSMAEQMLLDEFRKLNYNTKLILAQFSSNLHRKNINWWNEWITYPIAYQIVHVEAGAGGI